MRTLGSRVSLPLSCLTLTALTACGAPAAPFSPDAPVLARAEVVTSVERFLDDFIAPSFCAGEDVHWIGKVLILFHTTTNRGAPPPSEGIQHLVELHSVHFTGTGVTSGAVYRSNLSLNHSLQSPDPVDPFPIEQTLAFRERVIGPGGVVGVFTFRLKFVISGNGEVVVEWVRITDECR